MGLTLRCTVTPQATRLPLDAAHRFKFVVPVMMHLSSEAVYLAVDRFQQMGYHKLIILQMCGFQPGSALPLGFGQTICLPGYPKPVTVMRLRHGGWIAGEAPPATITASIHHGCWPTRRRARQWRQRTKPASRTSPMSQACDSNDELSEDDEADELSGDEAYCQAYSTS